MRKETNSHAGCPICKEPKAEMQARQEHVQGEHFHCPRCGEFILPFAAAEVLERKLDERAENRALLSYAVRRMQQKQQAPALTLPMIERLLKTSLPSITQQKESFVLCMGREAPLAIDQTRVFDARQVQAIIGAMSVRAVGLITNQLHEEGLLWVEWNPVGEPQFKAYLTFKGWEYFELLARGKSESRTAFMALEFGNDQLDQLIESVFKPAAKLTGFDLIRADDVPTAGLIDDHIRVLIRTARFVIADLTHDNPGAYWEAGFGEGLGKPVIYTCEKKKFEERKTHFDTSHCHTVTWDIADPETSGRALKATIRATLPAEAILTDRSVLSQS